MKQIKEKYRRVTKYWRVVYKQSSERQRLLLGAFAFMMLTYFWWAMLAL
ncbi:MAG TPA: hypothetical protein VHP14_25735 [Anaerolineales bacterium]|nr:hypothetical protein [Anaerolineales bacterium]